MGSKKSFIHSVVRDENGQRLGVVVAIGSGVVGFSKLHPGEGFDKRLGIAMAIARAFDPTTFAFYKKSDPEPVPPEFKYPLERIADASTRYFK